jgi:hypothetical protein
VPHAFDQTFSGLPQVPATWIKSATISLALDLSVSSTGLVYQDSKYLMEIPIWDSWPEISLIPHSTQLIPRHLLLLSEMTN